MDGGGLRWLAVAARSALVARYPEIYVSLLVNRISGE